MVAKYDKIIIGAGLYGLYSALFCVGGGKREHVLVLECDKTPFRRATYINQARGHQGYHYPRSISTAMKSCAKIERYQDAYVICMEDGKQDQSGFILNALYAPTNQILGMPLFDVRDFHAPYCLL